MVNEGIVLGHKISEKGIEVDKAKVDAIEKMPCPTDIRGIRSFLCHAGFYRRFIKDFSKISRPLTNLLQKYIPFIFPRKNIPFKTYRRILNKSSSCFGYGYSPLRAAVCSVGYSPKKPPSPKRISKRAPRLKN